MGGREHGKHPEGHGAGRHGHGADGAALIPGLEGTDRAYQMAVAKRLRQRRKAVQATAKAQPTAPGTDAAPKQPAAPNASAMQSPEGDPAIDLQAGDATTTGTTTTEGADSASGEADATSESGVTPPDGDPAFDTPPKLPPLREAFAMLAPVLKQQPPLAGLKRVSKVLLTAGGRLFDDDGTIKVALLASNPVAREALAPLGEKPGESWEGHTEAVIAAFQALLAPLVGEAMATVEEHAENAEGEDKPKREGKVEGEGQIHHLGKEPEHEEHEAEDDHALKSAGRVTDKRYPAQLVSVPHGYMGKKIELTPETAKAYEALLAHARGAGFEYPLFSIASAWRSDGHQAALSAKSKKRHGDESRKWVAKPGGSAHRTGHAIDFFLGEACDSANVEKIAKSAAYKWLKENAPTFGFAPYSAEPWHWEHNPVIEDEDEEGE